MRRLLVAVILSLSGLLPANSAEQDVQTASAFGQLQQLLGQRQWDDATQLATSIDEATESGDAVKAYAAAFRYAVTDECEKAKLLSTIAINSQPGFLPFYDPYARCLISEGDQQGAIDLYQNLADRLPDGVVKTAALQRIKVLKPDMRVRTSVELTLTPSTNVVRQTSEDNIGAFTIDPDSKSKPGVTIGGGINFAKPLFFQGRLSSIARLKIGLNYNSVNKLFYPVVGVENQFSYRINKKTLASITPFYEHMWQQDKHYRHTFGARAGVQHAIDETKTLNLASELSWHDYADELRSGLTASVDLSYAQIATPRDRITLRMNAGHIGAKSEFVRKNVIGAGAEWEHAFDNGFVPSIGVDLASSFYAGNAPLSTEKQWDFSTAATIGISHRKVKFGTIYPELALTATRQWSNNPFYKYNAYDAGIRLKTAF